MVASINIHIDTQRTIFLRTKNGKIDEQKDIDYEIKKIMYESIQFNTTLDTPKTSVYPTRIFHFQLLDAIFLWQFYRVD